MNYRLHRHNIWPFFENEGRGKAFSSTNPAHSALAPRSVPARGALPGAGRPLPPVPPAAAPGQPGEAAAVLRRYRVPQGAAKESAAEFKPNVSLFRRDGNTPTGIIVSFVFGLKR